MNNLPLPRQFNVRTVAGELYVYASFATGHAVQWAGPFTRPHEAEYERTRYSELNRITRQYRERGATETPASDAARARP